MSDHNKSTYQKEQDFIKKITKPYPHYPNCGCVECDNIYLYNMQAIATTFPCNNCGEPSKPLSDNSKKSFCNECTKIALDKAFKTLQVSLSIDPETGKHTDKLSEQQIQKAQQTLINTNPLNKTAQNL